MKRARLARPLNSKTNEVADTRMGAALPVLSVCAPLVKVNGAMLDTDGLRPARPSACRFSESMDTRLASDATNSDGTVCEPSARFENWTSCGGGVCGVYVNQGD